MLEALSGDTVVVMSIPAIIASISAIMAFAGVYWALKRSELDLKRRVKSLERRVGKLVVSEQNRYHRELAEGIVEPRDREPSDSLP